MENAVEPDLLWRHASGLVEASLAVMPVVVVMGARQTGKSTLVRSSPGLRERPYLTLDDLDLRAQARSAPDDLIRRAPQVVIDEIQREPDLILAIKRAVDDGPRQPGRFLVTGSANLLLMQRVSETLAGRAAYVPLWPLTRREQDGLGRPGIWSELLATPVADWYDLVRAQDARATDWRSLAKRGGYPAPAHQIADEDQRSVWFRGYVQTYLERDLQDLAAIDNLIDYRRLMRAAALRIGTVVNQAEVARDVGLSRPSAHRYLNLLEASFQIVRVPAYAVNRTKRLVKSPKLFWSDVGMALHLSGEEPRGAHLENLVLTDLVAWRDGLASSAQVLYWRTESGAEVDFVIEAGDRLLPIEVKASAQPRPDDARHLATFLDDYRDTARGALLLHTGDEVAWIRKGVLAVPWWRVL